MPGRELGVVLDSFGLPVKEGLRAAADLSFRRVELPVIGGQADPRELSRSGRRHLAHYVSSLGLNLSALGGDTGGGRFAEPARLDERLERLEQVLGLARELSVPVVTTHLGRLDEAALKQGHVAQAVEHIAGLADRTGIPVAFETGSADPATIGSLLANAGCPLLGTCYDPASLLIDGFDPLAGVEPLADRILIARARDAVAGFGQRYGRETTIGQGQVDFAEYLAALEQAGYQSSAFLRRTGSDRPAAEIAQAKAYLESIMR